MLSGVHVIGKIRNEKRRISVTFVGEELVVVDTDGSAARDVRVREFAETDWPQVWPIIRDIVRAGETFTYDPAMTAEQARDTWVHEPPGLTVVAVDGDHVLGTASMGANRPGPGSHVSTASFMVGAETRGRGVGSVLCRFALDWAREQGFAGMQFNAVAESNHSAVAIYERLGFTIVGTVPGAFRHPTLGRVGLHIMYCPFDETATTHAVRM